MTDNVIRVNVTTVAPKSISIQGSREQNYINATGDTSGYNAELAKKWAIGEGLIQNIDYSSKHYAGVAKGEAELAGENLSNVQELVNGFGEAVNTATSELIETKDTVLEEINSIGSTTIQEVETVSNQVSTEIDNKAKEAVTTINNAKNSGAATIQTTTTKAIQDIETIKTNAVNTANEANATINTNKTNAITEINNTKTTAVNAVNTSKNQALNDIEKESSSIVNFKEEVNAELENKVDLDDMVPFEMQEVPCITETYVNGTSWYRVYSDGWCEQGGKVANSIDGSTITFLKPFINANYTLTGALLEGSYTTTYEHFNISSVTETGFYFRAMDNYGLLWAAKGYIA